MPIAFIAGTVTVGSETCKTASVSCPKVPVSNLDGSFICAVSRPGTYVFTTHAHGYRPATTKVTIAKVTGKAKEVTIRLKPGKPTGG